MRPDMTTALEVRPAAPRIRDRPVKAGPATVRAATHRVSAPPTDRQVPAVTREVTDRHRSGTGPRDRAAVRAAPMIRVRTTRANVAIGTGRAGTTVDRGISGRTGRVSARAVRGLRVTGISVTGLLAGEAPHPATGARTATAPAAPDAEMTTAGAARVARTAIAEPATVGVPTGIAVPTTVPAPIVRDRTGTAAVRIVRDRTGTAAVRIGAVQIRVARIVGVPTGTAARTTVQVRIVGDQIGADPTGTAAALIAAVPIAAVPIGAARAAATGRVGRTGAMRRIAAVERIRVRAIRGRPAARSGSLTRCCPMT
jgi:hypothetical protein